MKGKKLFTILIVSLLSFLGGTALAEGDADLAGYWVGSIEIPNRPLETMLAVDRGDDGGWSVRIDIPAQSIRRIPLAEVTIEGGRGSFVIPEVPGDPKFDGTLSEDGATFSGTFTQGGQSLPFTLRRAERPADYDVDFYAEYRKPGAAGEGLVGDWRALLTAGPHRLRFDLSVREDEEGLGGVLVNVDQGGQEAPVADLVLAEDGSVRFEIPVAGTSYEGTLSDDGSTITGNWKQGGQEIPLEFRRSGN